MGHQAYDKIFEQNLNYDENSPSAGSLSPVATYRNSNLNLYDNAEEDEDVECEQVCLFIL